MGDVVYYPYFLKVEDRDVILLWFNGKDGDVFFKLNEKKLFSESTQDSACVRAKELGLFIEWEDVNVIVDFNRLHSAVNSLKANESISEEVCVLLLEGWNFLEDLFRIFPEKSKEVSLNTSMLKKFYQKLFYGNNLEAVKKNNETYNPVFSEEEVNEFIGNMRGGVQFSTDLIRNNM
ncbi:MAG: hypothetical protein ACRBCK_06465 [Alphaproteobacteria bacterium]